MRPKIASAGGRLCLVWEEELVSHRLGSNVTLYAQLWNGRAFVEELDAPRVELGMPARITADGLAGELRGRVIRLSPRMSRKRLWSDDPAERYDTKTREVWIELDEAEEGLVVGLRVDATLEPASDPDPAAPASDPGEAHAHEPALQPPA